MVWASQLGPHSQPPLWSLSGSTQLESDSFWAGGSSKLGSGLTCSAAPDLPFGAGKTLSLRCASPSEGIPLGELIRGSDSHQMLLCFDSTACDDDLVLGPPFAYFLSWPGSVSPKAVEAGGAT